jgi:hypothetical protein
VAARARYPLEAARTLRAEEEERRAEELVAANAASDEAQLALERARSAWTAHRGETRRVAAEEAARDRAGRAVAETLRTLAWLDRRGREAAELGERALEAEQTAARARAAVEEAKASLAQARAEREAVEKHHAEWTAAQKRALEAREEEEADERNTHRGSR